MSFKTAKLGFFLQSKSDVVDVTVINSDEDDVATMRGSGDYIVARNGNYHYFYWDGRLADGSYAPAGTYTFNALFQHQDRNVPITGASVTVLDKRPTPRVSAVTVGTTTSPTPAAAGAPTPQFTPGSQSGITMTLKTGGKDLGANVLIYRAPDNPNGKLKLVKTFGINSHKSTATWDGYINGKPAPAGSYLLGLQVKDASCTTGRFPQVLDPAPGSTSGAGLNISYLTAEPPLTPVSAGQSAAVTVHSGGAPYTWALRVAGQSAVVGHGSDRGDGTLKVPLRSEGLYTLTLSSGRHRTSVPLVASGGARANASKVLVVLPALSWQGANATDDNSDGQVDTLTAGSQINLERPFTHGLPSGIADEAALLSELNAEGRTYQLTTDVALAEGTGPSLNGRHGVLLDGRFRWLPTQLAGRLRSFVNAGGAVFSDGIGSLQAESQIADGNYGPIAQAPRRLARDPFGAVHAAISPTRGEIITSLTDHLGVFGTDFALQTDRYQVLQPPSERVDSAAGVAQVAPAIIGFGLGKGTVVEVGLAGFGSSLTSDPNSDQLLSNVWDKVLR